MCGIFGCIVPKKHNNETRFDATCKLQTLALLNRERGVDSVGIANIKNDGEVAIFKRIGSSLDWVTKTDFVRDLYVQNNTSVIIGHTRRASPGSPISEENAHPFIMGNVVGVHNGIIYNWREFLEDVTVDSKALFHLLDRMGLKAIPKCQGAAAFAFVNKEEPNRLNLFRHDRPLAVAKDPSNGIVFFSSEEDHLKKALNKHLVEIKIIDDQVLMLAPDDAKESAIFEASTKEFKMQDRPRPLFPKKDRVDNLLLMEGRRGSMYPQAAVAGALPIGATSRLQELQRHANEVISKGLHDKERVKISKNDLRRVLIKILKTQISKARTQLAIDIVNGRTEFYRAIIPTEMKSEYVCEICDRVSIGRGQFIELRKHHNTEDKAMFALCDKCRVLLEEIESRFAC